MKHSFILLIISIALGSVSMCPDNSSSEEKVVKIVKTKAFSTKTEFDKLVCDKPVYNLGYDKTIGMDFTWTTNYFDQYNNVVRSVRFMLDDNGNEEIISTTFNQYYLPEEHKLSYVKTKKFGTEEIKYIRDNNGKLLEIIKYQNGERYEKTVLSYNETGQRIKVEIYEKDGLKETNLFTYDLTDLDKDHIIKEIETNFKRNYQIKKEYEWSNSGKIVRYRKKYFENGELLSDLTTSYNPYIGDIVTEEITEGYDAGYSVSVNDSIIREIEGEHFRMKVTKTINSNNDVLKYSYEYDHIDDNGQVISPTKLEPWFGNDSYTYECKYTYNNKKDWNKLLFLAHNEKYLIFREIKYFE